jgi:hypothetical protein
MNGQRTGRSSSVSSGHGKAERMSWRFVQLAAAGYPAADADRRLGAVSLRANLAGSFKPVASKQKEEGLRHEPQIHDAKNAIVVDPAKVIDDRLTIVDDGGAGCSSMLDLSQPRGGTTGSQKITRHREKFSRGAAAGEHRPTQHPMERNSCRIDGEYVTAPAEKEQRMDDLGRLKRLAVPIQPFKQAVERMSGVKACSAPSAGHLVRVDRAKVVKTEQPLIGR